MAPARQFVLGTKSVVELKRAEEAALKSTTRMRYLAVRLYGSGYGWQEVESITGCGQRSVERWCKTYRDDGIAGLLDQRLGGNRAKLTAEQLDVLRVKLHSYTPAQLFGRPESGEGASDCFWTIATVKRLVKQECNVEYRCDESYQGLLHKCGMSYQRPGHVYKSRSQDKVADFEERLEKK